MKMSRRAKRMERNHKRKKAAGGLNLTALMDIFTILVFFLMVNQSEVEVQSNDAIELPVSLAENKPSENVTIMISQDEILVRGRSVVSTADASAEGEQITELSNELEYLAGRMPLPPGAEDQGRPVTIMGDKSTPYTLLKKVMNTSAKAGFNNISLAVNQKAPGQGGE
ncbi:ExbD/TolR family protein [Thalassolituus sp. UBA1505]|uniref:ExbD/TolR family protein n=2 Tax=unclassified Thalassolituus TaxID=2624967 RepID=UPI0025E47F8B|nr:biopolymer transporter ExbD [Thalassolituus sp. UBA1505]|tara:strand:+ start:3706 stop:4209 length:504 start_codon:yes stop_codon:yes gene_type:complete